MALELLRCLSLFLIVFTAGVGAAQVQPLQPRDRVPPQQTGTGRIKGRVLDAQSGSAVSRARVRILGQGNLLPSASTTLRPSRISQAKAAVIQLFWNP